jgi:isopenicillin N synthase-like dioxygenase
VNTILKERWFSLSDEDKKTWKRWEQWDAKRYAHHMLIFTNAKDHNDFEESNKSEADASEIIHVPKKRKIPDEAEAASHRDPLTSIPKKSRH